MVLQAPLRWLLPGGAPAAGLAASEAACWRGALAALGAVARGSVSLLEALQVVAPMEEEDLEDCMEKVRLEALPWEGQGLVFVRPLQEAARNQGRVDVMADMKMGHFFAVKRMPNSWVCASHAAFTKAHPSSGERPWCDLGFLRYLNDIGFPYAPELRGVFLSGAETFTATALCGEGDLFSWCDLDSVPRSGKDRERSMLPIVVQVFTAVRWLHNLGIAHRDLSLENILLSSTRGGRPAVRVCDFGMSTLRRRARREIRGKLPYQAPEMYVDAAYDTFLVDNFALGVLLFAMAAQDYPWTTTQRNSCQLFEYVNTFGVKRFLQKRKLRKGCGEYLIDVFSPAFTDLVEALMRVQHGQRASIGEACFAGGARGRGRGPGRAAEGRPGLGAAKGVDDGAGGRQDVWDMAWLGGCLGKLAL